MQKKNLLFGAIILFSSLVANAQIEKKDWLLGGSFGYNSTNFNSGSANSNANIVPHIGYAIGNNSVVGLNFSVSFYQNESENKSFSWYTYAYYKKFFPIKQKFGAYLQLNAGIGWNKYSSYIYDSLGTGTKITSNYHAYLVSVVPGVYYHVTPGILLNADCGGISYNYTKGQYDSWNSSFVFNFLSSFTFGVDFILGRKKS
ncbi:MAG TPA: outer membrane beta-barrel protein [Puia sp.]|nr:outer membrane beta-barrel protein [Puia sp.]